MFPTFPLKQTPPLQMYPQSRVDIRNSAVGMCEALSHANPSTLPVQNPTLPCRRSLVCLQPPTAYRLRHNIRRSGDPQIFPSLPPPPDRTSQPPRRCPIYAPQHCPAAKASMVIWPSFRDRRLTWAYRPVGAWRSLVGGRLLPLVVFSHPTFAYCSIRVDCKFAVLYNKKKFWQKY